MATTLTLDNDMILKDEKINQKLFEITFDALCNVTIRINTFNFTKLPLH